MYREIFENYWTIFIAFLLNNPEDMKYWAVYFFAMHFHWLHLFVRLWLSYNLPFLVARVERFPINRSHRNHLYQIIAAVFIVSHQRRLRYSLMPWFKTTANDMFLSIPFNYEYWCREDNISQFWENFSYTYWIKKFYYFAKIIEESIKIQKIYSIRYRFVSMLCNK